MKKYKTAPVKLLIVRLHTFDGKWDYVGGKEFFQREGSGGRFLGNRSHTMAKTVKLVLNYV